MVDIVKHTTDGGGQRIKWMKNLLRERILEGFDPHSDSVMQKSRQTDHSVLSRKVGDKIKKMEVWMRQKRYSESTIKTYLSFVKGFFAANPDRPQQSEDDNALYAFEWEGHQRHNKPAG